MGVFVLPGPEGVDLQVISGIGLGWEHVSVVPLGENRTPTWAEMQFVKEGFWRDDDVVMQIHPTSKDYVNCHDTCLHLWRPLFAEIPTPPTFLVGPKGMDFV